MTSMELIAILKQWYHNPPEGETATMVHLFGIMYADEIRECGTSIEDITVHAGLSTNYAAEVRKGMRLRKYVEPKRGITLPQAAVHA